MKDSEVQKLNFGVYRIHWKKSAGGGTSIGMVGQTHSGKRWLTCPNWTCADDAAVQSTDLWYKVKKIELITGE